MPNWLQRLFQFFSPRGIVIGRDNSGAVFTGNIRGDVLICQGQHYSLNLHIPFRGQDETELSDLNLLTWKSRIPSQLYGRDDEQAALLAWAHKATKFSVAIVQGGAGTGKTRLAFELADRLQQQGWAAGQVADPSQPIAFVASPHGCCLIFDYPEEQSEAIKQFFTRLNRSKLEAAIPKLRVLLLCRDATQLKKNTDIAPHLGLEQKLSGLPASDPWALFQAAYREIAQRQQPAPLPPVIPLSQAEFMQWQTRDRQHQTPLLILAYALSLLHNPQQRNVPHQEIIAGLWARERQHWQTEAQQKGWSAAEIQGGIYLYALAAITAGLTGDELHDLHQHFAKLDLGGMVFPALHQWQKLAVWDKQQQQLPAITPDLFAAHALYALLDEIHPSITAQPPLHYLLTLPPRTGQSAESKQEQHFNRLARLMLDRPTKKNPLLSLLIKLVEQEDQIKFVWANSLQKNYLPFPLIPLACVVESALVAYFEEENDLPKLAASLNSLSVSQAQNGDRLAALRTIQRAVEIWEKLAKENFAAYAPELAQSLNNLSISQAENGDRPAALRTIQRAVEIRQKLAKENFTTYAPVLAQSLNNLSNRQAENGNRQASLRTIQQAVEIYEPLAAETPAAYAPCLAESLNNFSISQAENGDRLAALHTMEKAVEIRQQLAAENFAAYAPDFALSLSNLSVYQANTGNRQAALLTIQHAVEIYEQLAAENFAAYVPALAVSLYNFALRQVDVVDYLPALANLRRAIELITPFATPGTTYADWLDSMENTLPILEKLVAESE